VSGIKGSAMEAVVADVNRLVEAGRLSREELEVRLAAADLKILDSKIFPASWYPLETYGRLSELLMEAEGHGDPEALQATGIYSQLSANRKQWGDRIVAIMASIGPAMFKDSEWSSELENSDDALRFRIRVKVPPGFPEAGRFAAQGFIAFRVHQNGSDRGIRVTSRRVSSTEIEFSAR
jgi:hypothetical protein